MGTITLLNGLDSHALIKLDWIGDFKGSGVVIELQFTPGGLKTKNPAFDRIFMKGGQRGPGVFALLLLDSFT